MVKGVKLNIGDELARQEIFEKTLEDKTWQDETGGSDAEVWFKRRTEILDREEIAAEKKNKNIKENRKLKEESEALIIKIREESDIRQSGRITSGRRQAFRADLRLLQERDRLFAAQQEEQRKLDEIERIKIAEFWLDYFKLKVKLTAGLDRSQLNFGGLF